MGITSAELYIKILFYVSMLSALVLTVGIVSFNSDLIDLDNDSIVYVESYTEYHSQTGFDAFDDTPIGETAKTEVLTGDNDTGEVIATDNFAIPKSIQGSTSAVPNFLKVTFNIPNLVLTGMGFNTKDWTIYVNIFGYIFGFISLIILVKLIFNGGQTK